MLRAAYAAAEVAMTHPPWVEVSALQSVRTPAGMVSRLPKGQGAGKLRCLGVPGNSVQRQITTRPRNEPEARRGAWVRKPANQFAKVSWEGTTTMSTRQSRTPASRVKGRKRLLEALRATPPFVPACKRFHWLNAGSGRFNIQKQYSF